MNLATTRPWTWSLLAVVAAAVMGPLLSQSQAAPAAAERSVAGVRLSDRGSLCAVKPQDSVMRHALEGYAAGPEFGAPGRSRGRFAAFVEGPPDQLLDEARKKGCAVLVADAEQVGQVVAALIGTRSPHQALGPRPVQETLSALVAAMGLERYEQLVLLEALPPGGGQDDLQLLAAAGVNSAEQLASLSAAIVQSGYATSVDMSSLRQFLADQKQGAGEGKTARQVQQAREAAEAADRKQRAEAQERQAREAERAATWEQAKNWAIGIAVLVAVIFGGWVMAGSSSQCPACQKWFAQQRLQTHEVGRSTGYETETKVDQYKNTKGEVVLTKERQEQVRYTYVQHQHLNQCKFCSHQWWSQSSTKYKG